MIDVSIAGDDAPVPILERAWVQDRLLDPYLVEHRESILGEDLVRIRGRIERSV